MQTWTYSQPTPRLVALAGAVAGDAMADPIEAAELLDVDVDESRRGVALVAADRLGRLERRKRLRPRRLQDAADGRGRDADSPAICLPV